MSNNTNNHNRITNRHHHHHHQSPVNSTTTTRSNSSTVTTNTTTSRSTTSTTQACAACRYRRRKCAPDCLLAPYFPHDRHRQFQNAHKLFGVSNITKLIRDLDPVQKDEAMRTIIYQADVRAHDPVGGCYRIIRELHRQIEMSRAELEIVLQQLAFCRNPNPNNFNQNQMQIFRHHLDHILIDGVDYDLDLGQIGQQQEHEDDQYIQIFNDGDHNDGNCEDNDDDQQAVSIQQINSWGRSPQSSAVSLSVKPAVVDECQDFKPVMIDEVVAAGDQRRQFKFAFDDINEASEVLAKEENVALFTKEENHVTTYQQHMNEDHDLKGAATLFTLTNCSSY